VDQGLEALIGFAGAHGDAFELLEFAEEVFDEVSPFVHFQIDIDGADPLRHLRDDDLCPALVELFDDPVGVEGLVTEQCIELNAFDERGHADGVIAISGQKLEAHEVAQGIAQGEYLGCPTALGLAYGLILSPPFAPWP
jgi:hypothetical protein